MKDPYKILGLSRGANSDEVKRAYRRLAKEFHPDLNPGASEEKFHEIAFAYEFLTNPKYQVKKEVANKRSEDEKRERYESAKRRYKEQVYKEYIEEQKFYEREISGFKRKYFNVIFVVCTLFNLLLLIDVILPGDWQNEDHVEIERGGDYGGFSHIRLQKIRSDNVELYISSGQINELRSNGFLSVELSKIFGFHKRVGVKGKSHYHILSPGFSYMSSFPVLNILLLIPLIARWLMDKRNLTFLLFYRLSLFGIPPLFLAVLFFYF